MVIVVIVMVCNRASRQNRSHYAASKLPPYDGYDYADLDEQYGLEPDTVKAYNIDGGNKGISIIIYIYLLGYNTNYFILVNAWH